jgi:hypothetical protein
LYRMDGIYTLVSDGKARDIIQKERKHSSAHICYETSHDEYSALAKSRQAGRSLGRSRPEGAC